MPTVPISGLTIPSILPHTSTTFQSFTRWWFQTLYIFLPLLGEMIQFDGLKPPTIAYVSSPIASSSGGAWPGRGHLGSSFAALGGGLL